MFIDIESLIDMFGEKENCIRCGKPIDCRDWVCLACKAEIAKVDISERKFELLHDAQRQKIVDMSAQEFLEYCGGDSFLMTAEEQEVYNIKSRNDNKLKNTEYECEKCNNNLHIHTIQWNNEYKRFFDVSEPCECVKVRKSIELMKEAIKSIRNIRAEMNVAPSKKAKVIVVSENEDVRNIFLNLKIGVLKSLYVFHL